MAAQLQLKINVVAVMSGHGPSGCGDLLGSNDQPQQGRDLAWGCLCSEEPVEGALHCTLYLPTSPLSCLGLALAGQPSPRPPNSEEY